MTAETETGSVEMRVVDVRRPQTDGEEPRMYAVVLKEIEGARYLPIWVGRFEAEAIALQLSGVEPNRPMAYAFAASLLQALGGRLREVRISRLAGDTFYAVAEVEGPAGARSIDARPSDALNLALIAGAPIRADRAVLDAVGVRQDEADAHPRAGSLPPGAAREGAAEIAAEITARWREHRGDQPPPR